ncbi:aminoacyl-tRNA hydrolase [Actinomycetospora termitidis]|uniref:Aminoacyl-tRNA hydrolase n=1 Tax=Actinomycetospora termitidis TaxID=3053470 RepID=A0ABT7M3B7_9PSEU|nr:aminoacyl-tRNA hydrolase [Actinomycetospora sp. Odt1-22]MDL5154497.1 aminoacyl-tRNA hydrolase [Actinomycetospora sp. Odt1-22]
MDSTELLPAHALTWRFSRSSGPGGQGVNTTDSRVELLVDLAALPDPERLVERLGPVLHVTASEHRSQLRNREAALERAAERIARARRPDPPSRTPRRPSRGAKLRRLEDKRRRSDRKAMRRAPSE